MLKAFLASLPDEAARKAFAADCGTSLGHLRNCIYLRKPIAEKTCVQIEQHSAQRVMRWHLRQDWPEIWPELLTLPSAPIVADQHRTVTTPEGNAVADPGDGRDIDIPPRELEAARAAEVNHVA